MGKAHTPSAASKTSITSASTKDLKTKSTDKSSILKLAFSPSRFQLRVFASVIQSFETQQLRLHDINSGRLRQQHALKPKTAVTSLDWGHYSTVRQENGQSRLKKKRKKTSVTEDVVIAYGTTASEICMFSPTEGQVINSLSGHHERGIKDFRFCPSDREEGWSIGEEGNLVQWNLTTNEAVRSIPLDDPSVQLLSTLSLTEPRILCASNTPYVVNTSAHSQFLPFDSFKGQIHSVMRSQTVGIENPEFMIAADHDRYINLFEIQTRKLVRTLVTNSGVESLDLAAASEGDGNQQGQILAAVTVDGTVELFSRPFKSPPALNGDVKSKQKNKTRKADAVLKLIDSKKKQARIFAVSIQGPDLYVATVDNGVEPNFQKVRWQDEGNGELLFDGTKEIVKMQSSSTLNSAHMNGVKDMSKTFIDESRTVVTKAVGEDVLRDAAIEISSEDEDVDEDDASVEENNGDIQATEINGENDGESNSTSEELDETMVDTTMGTNSESTALVPVGLEDEVEMDDAEKQEPSFGDLAASKYPDTVTIADSFAPERSVFDSNRELAIPAGMSLGTVLTQALRSNDSNLLESCLHANDAGIIQNTVQRLDSTLAGSLLSKLAERIASRPGRYGHLLLWVQWTCITHGGALAAQPGMAAKIGSLYGVLQQRSHNLDKLLLLKGKLDMLDAQLTFRRQIQAQRNHEQDRGEPGMIYIEGQTDNWSSEDDDNGDDVDGVTGIARKSRKKRKTNRALEDLIDQTSDDSEGDMPTTNGVLPSDSDMDEEEDSDEDRPTTDRVKDGFYDSEAEVSGTDEEKTGDDADDSDGDGEDEEDDDDDDDAINSFINDGEISLESEEDDDDDNVEEHSQIRQPERKKHKSRH